MKENKSFKCEVCDYSWSQKKDLNRHVASVHEGNKPFKVLRYSLYMIMNPDLALG